MNNSIKRILVVDNEVEFVKTLQRHLKRKGFSVDVAYDGSNGIDRIKTSSVKGDPFDLVITDVVMPNMGGIELLRWVKRNYPSLSVLLISGFGDTDLVIENIRAELDAYVQKPVTPRQMMALIRKLNQNRSLHYLEA